MNNALDGINAIHKQEAIIETARAEIERIKQEMVARFCPHKVGDVVPTTGLFIRASNKISVTDIRVGEDYSNDFFWHLSGPRIKKDGKPGRQRDTATIYIKEK